MSAIKYLAAGAALAIVCSLGLVHPAAAQTSSTPGKSQRQLDIAAARADRKAIVGANMNLTEAQAKAFWPLYDAYEARMDKLDDRHAAEVKAYAEHYQTLTDADATPMQRSAKAAAARSIRRTTACRARRPTR